MAVEALEEVFGRPLLCSYQPGDLLDGAAGVAVPEMYADRLIGLVRGAVVVVCDVPVVAPVPTGLQSHVGVVDGVET